MARPPIHTLAVVCLVAMATAAPLAGENDNQEQSTKLEGDTKPLDRAKRAKEEVVFGNQQNSAKSLSAAKKSGVDLPSLPLNQDNAIPNLSDKASDALPSFSDNADKTGYVYAAKQVPVSSIQDETAAEMQAIQPEDGLSQEGEEGPILEEIEMEPLDPIPQHTEDISDPEASAHSLDTQAHIMSELPENSRNADAEEALQAPEETQTSEADDIENFLKELQVEPHEADESNEDDEDEMGDKDESEEEEGSAEKQLTQETQQTTKAGGKSGDPMEYTKELLKYILAHGDNYGRLPLNYGYPYPSAYYIRRRRRSLAHRRHLSHIHRRHNRGNKQLARSKRTKRDLFDDDMYYNNPARKYELQRVEEQAEKQAEMKELISYLMAMYPALYEDQLPPKESPYPGYMWYGAGSPEKAYPDYEEPEYVEVPVGWDPASLSGPAWEPAFYPEQLEAPGYYPTPAKRQMMNMFPGQRRKRFFYPYAEEPYAHWGAFIPSQKRDYENAYRHLRDLASELADYRQPPLYLDRLSNYKKK